MNIAFDDLAPSMQFRRRFPVGRAAAMLAASVLCGACAGTPDAPRNFEECLARGNGVMESMPRQCRDGRSGKLFRETGGANDPAK